MWSASLAATTSDFSRVSDMRDRCRWSSSDNVPSRPHRCRHRSDTRSFARSRPLGVNFNATERRSAPVSLATRPDASSLSTRRTVERGSGRCHPAGKSAKRIAFELNRECIYLFSGLTKCGCCGGGYSMISADLVGCSTARNKGACENRKNIQGVNRRGIRTPFSG